jgi:hypothetical protein
MPEYDNTNKGALFKNAEKRPPRQMKNEDGTEWIAHDPDYTGEADINGVLHFVDGYLQKSKAGKTYMRLKFKPKGQPKAKPQGLTEDNWATADFDDKNIPF